MADRIIANTINSKWEISWDGYYPYCKNCCYEPSYNEVVAGLPDTCPKCGANMSNYIDMQLHKEKVTI